MRRPEAKIEVPVEVLQALLFANLENGLLWWKFRDPERFGTTVQWNARFAGAPAFTASTTGGYKIGSIFGRLYKAHRVLVALRDGFWPDGEVDHIDRNPANNSATNLRVVSRSVNLKNASRWRNNTSGANGVWWDACRCMWVAEVTQEGCKTFLGRFWDKESAVLARKLADKALGFSPGHGSVRGGADG